MFKEPDARARADQVGPRSRVGLLEKADAGVRIGRLLVPTLRVGTPSSTLRVVF
jgi:hypothetical protein